MEMMIGSASVECSGEEDEEEGAREREKERKEREREKEGGKSEQTLERE